MQELIINTEFQDLIPSMSQEEYLQLEQNIIADGCRDALVVWQNTIVDGHNRYKICTDNNIEFNVIEKKFNSDNDVAIWMLGNQFGRRNISKYVRAELALKLKPRLAAKDKKNQGYRTDIPQISEECQKEQLKKIWDESEGLNYDHRVRLQDNKRMKIQKENRRIHLSNTMQIYIAKHDNRIKIGVSSSPDGRMEQLKTACPTIALIFSTKGNKKLENKVHKKFSEYSDGGEWFVFDDKTLNKVITYIKKESLRENSTDAQLAKQAGVSHDTIAKVERIQKEAPQETIDKIKSGDISINQAYNEVKKPHVSNNSGNNEWYTPKEFIESAKVVLNEIDVDPASSEIANKTVQAKKFYTEEDNGLNQEWRGSLWMNPPYSQPEIKQFSDKLCLSFDDAKVTEAIVLVNNATETSWFQNMARRASAVCFPEKRIKFVDPKGSPSGAPLQGQAILYLGDDISCFKDIFSLHGMVFVS